jgi:Zn-dependent protease/predicted transcriptional regulator
MEESLRLGRLFGIRIGVNWSVLVIFGLILLVLSTGLFPAAAPDRSPVVHLLSGLVGAGLFFVSLLAHELSHAVVAQRNGVEVEGITLWMFGGVARLEGEAPDPGAELRIAGVGPLVSFVLAVTFAALTWLTEGLLGSGLSVELFRWLAVINLALAVFNLAPAAPLDGGRILRALLWWRRGDRTSAALTAARAGRIFGFALVGLGVVQLVMLPGFGGLWMILIGFFIANAAAAEGSYAQVQAGLAGLRVADVMTPDPLVLPQHLSVEQAVDTFLLPNRFSSFPVVDPDGRPSGLVTLQQIKQVPRDAWGMTSIQRVASPMDLVATAAPREALVEVLPRLRAPGGGGRLLVVEQGAVVGIVSPTDIARVLDRAPLRADGRPSPWSPTPPPPPPPPPGSGR